MVAEVMTALAAGARPDQNAQQQAQQAAQEAQRQAQQAQQDAQRQAQQAQRDAQQAQREAQQTARQAQLEARQAAQQAQIEARQAIREAQRELERVNGQGRPAVAFPPGFPVGPQIPEGAVIISVAFFVMCAVIAIGFPIARAIARRMDKRSIAAPADTETRSRLERIEQAVDAIAVEVERISEGQRFTTKLMAEIRGLPQPDPAASLAERAAADRSAVPVSRAREAR